MPPRCVRALVKLSILALPGRLDAQPPRDTLRVGVVISPAQAQRADSASIARGVELGTEEATRTAALFGVSIQVVQRVAVGESASRAAQQLVDQAVTVIVLAAHGEACVAPLGAGRRAVLLTLTCRHHFDGADSCGRTAFHLAPSDSTSARALALHTSDEGLRRDARVVAWHHSLARFGAEQLNERFRRRFGAEMDAPAWTAWLAMKIVAETALRARTTQGADLARYLARRDTRFDGHKGEPLTFDARTGELRQPLYVLGGAPIDERVAAVLTSAMIFPPSIAGSDQAPECAAGSGG
jgi:ABC-type branched-subunit amino acid transport system substrate-binding protein